MGFNYPNLIRKIGPNGAVTTIAGNFGTSGLVNGNVNVATFNVPQAIVRDASGNLLISEVANHDIRKLTPDGVVSTLAGNGKNGFLDGTGTNAAFQSPARIALDATGNCFAVDVANNALRMVTPGGVVTTVAGNGSQTSVDGIGTAASFISPMNIAIAPTGEIYVSEQSTLIRKIVMQ